MVINRRLLDSCYLLNFSLGFDPKFLYKYAVTAQHLHTVQQIRRRSFKVTPHDGGSFYKTTLPALNSYVFPIKFGMHNK